MFQVYKAVSIGLQQGKHKGRTFSGLFFGEKGIFGNKKRNMRISEAQVSLVLGGMVAGRSREWFHSL